MYSNNEPELQVVIVETPKQNNSFDESVIRESINIEKLSNFWIQNNQNKKERSFS